VLADSSIGFDFFATVGALVCESIDFGIK